MLKTPAVAKEAPVTLTTFRVIRLAAKVHDTDENPETAAQAVPMGTVI